MPYWHAEPQRAYREVFGLAGLPAPVAQVITLDEGIIWRLNGAIDIGDNQVLVPAGATLRGRSPQQDSIAAAHVNAAYKRLGPAAPPAGSLPTCDLRDLQINNTAGPAIAYDGLDNGILRMNQVYFDGTAPSTFVDAIHVIMDTCAASNATAGISLDGAIKNFVATNCMFGPLANDGQVGIDILADAVLNRLNVLQCGFLALTNDIGIRQDALATVGDARLTDCRFPGAGTPISGFTKGSTEWWLRGNSGNTLVLNSTVNLCAGYASSTPVAFANPGAGTFGDIPGAVTVRANERIITTATPGRYQYVGADPVEAQISGAVAMQTASGNANVGLTVFLGDPEVQIPDLEFAATAGNNVTANINVECNPILQPGDFFKLQLRTIGSAPNLDVFAKATNVKL